jgi:hypothetical protein
MNQSSPLATIDDPREGTFIRRFQIEEPGEYELTLDRYGDEVTVTFTPVAPIDAGASRFMVV